MLDRLHGLTDGALIILPEESSEELERHPRQRLSVRRPRPADAARRADPVRLGRAHVRRRPGDAAPARARAPADRADHRADAAGSRPRTAAAATARRLRRRGSCPTLRSRSRRSRRSTPGGTPRTTLLDLPDPPTAIFAFNDNIAIGAIQAARARGLRVPDDLSIVGFDDVEHATIVTPGADDGPPAARRDGTHRGQPPEPAAGAAELRDAPRRARDAPRRPRLDGAAPHGLAPLV